VVVHLHYAHKPFTTVYSPLYKGYLVIAWRKAARGLVLTAHLN